jgi:GTP cyclohydrolase FolE2
MTNESRFNAFKEANVYKEFQETHEKAEIGKEVFRLTVCPCVRNLGQQSCVDLLQSGLNQYMTAIDNALKHDMVIKKSRDVRVCSPSKGPAS